MKKIVLALVASIILMSCVTAPKDVSRADFEGEWRQVDGSSVITFKKNKIGVVDNFELVDMERGSAGFATFTLEDRMKSRGEYRIIIKDGYFQDLGVMLGNWEDYNKDVVVKAWNEYKIPVSERENINRGLLLTTVRSFNLNGDDLKLGWMSNFGTAMIGYPPDADCSPDETTFVNGVYDSLLGDFVRTR